MHLKFKNKQVLILIFEYNILLSNIIQQEIYYLRLNVIKSAGINTYGTKPSACVSSFL